MQDRLHEPLESARLRFWRAFFLSACLHLLLLGLVTPVLNPGFPGGLSIDKPVPFVVATMKPRSDAPAFIDAALPEQETALFVNDEGRDDEPAQVAAEYSALPERLEPVTDSAPLPEVVRPSIYLPAQELAEPPVPIDVRPLAVPDAKGPAAGRIVIEVLVNESGSVDHVRTLESNVPGPFLIEVFKVFKAAQYLPGRILGKPVKASLRIEVFYDESRSGSSPPITMPVQGR